MSTIIIQEVIKEERRLQNEIKKTKEIASLLRKKLEKRSNSESIGVIRKKIGLSPENPV